jgi:putative transposase
VVFIPKCRRKALYRELRRHLGEVFRKLALQRESKVGEGHLMPDHVHMLLSIPPKYAVSQVVGYIKGKSAIHLARVYGERKRNFVGQHFWARGFFVNTVGRDEAGSESHPALPSHRAAVRRSVVPRRLAAGGARYGSSSDARRSRSPLDRRWRECRRDGCPRVPAGAAVEARRA